jgi:hypothetical protein
MSAAFPEQAHMRRPEFTYDADLDEAGQQVCDELFDVIAENPATAATTYAEFSTSTELESAARTLAEPTKDKSPENETETEPSEDERYRAKVIQATGQVLIGDYDFYIAYDHATERAAKDLRDRAKNHNDGSERTRIGRLGLYATRLAIYNSQNPEQSQTAATA